MSFRLKKKQKGKQDALAHWEPDSAKHNCVPQQEWVEAEEEEEEEETPSFTRLRGQVTWKRWRQLSAQTLWLLTLEISTLELRILLPFIFSIIDAVF
jgi:hypothetical protein